MSDLTVLSIGSRKKEDLIKALADYYYPNFKIENTVVETRNTSILAIGTLIRLEKDDIWYDIPIVQKYSISNNIRKNELFELYIRFLKEVYLAQTFYIIVEDKEFESVFQISEEERLKKLYYE